ncbi:uncharacterized protein JN550_006386 [Neoarthrinium moseri]|uniref:uncharacterized protein n=1 Tax=Neoarthrinium moseri TaxID=1658444 RepID=UPI001FDC63B9|nr:uncharacterized protein JN550_006386 [Neoarthrinium moseri]KAI1868470.1 hypothetical protein JN550_006386 [Neoarthrinium moseri]
MDATDSTMHVKTQAGISRKWQPRRPALGRSPYVTELDNLLGVLATLRSQLADRTFRPSEVHLASTIESAITQCDECVQELRSEADKLKKTPVDSLQTAIKATGRRIAYPIRQSTLQRLDEDIDELVSQLSLALQLLQQGVIDRIEDAVEDASVVLDLVRASQVSSEIRDWLKAPDASINFNEACKMKHAGTGLWFVKGESFSAWLQQANSFLWLQGFAGCGKSVLCSTAIQHTLRHRRSSPRIGVAFFFFTFNDESKQDASAMLRALILQLAGQLRDNPAALLQLYQNYRNATPPSQAFLDCLRRLTQTFREVHIIVDALDESPRGKHREAVLEVIRDIRAWSEPRLHLLITSRNEVDIRKEPEVTPAESIALRNDDVDNDIAVFISHHLRNSRHLKQWEAFYDQIEEALVKKAKGVFRWVECQFKALAECPESEDLLEQLLQSLPNSLDETYRRMLENIPAAWNSYARQMLTLLCCATRPLTVPELIDAIAIETGDYPRFNPKRRLRSLDALQKVCPGFTEVDLNHDEKLHTVRIAHFSVQEYLESERISLHGEAASFRLDRQESNATVACTCLALLLEPCVIGLKADDIRDEYPFAEYAARYWPRHFEKSSQALDVEKHIIRLFRDVDGAFQVWKVIRRFKNVELTITPFHCAALLGSVSVLESLCSEETCSGHMTGSQLSFELNKFCGRFETALTAAASGGHKEIVRLLIDKGADINAQWKGSNGTALQFASFQGHKDIVELLIDKGANINDEGARQVSTALNLASSKEIEELLINKGAVYGAMELTLLEAQKEAEELSEPAELWKLAVFISTMANAKAQAEKPNCTASLLSSLESDTILVKIRDVYEEIDEAIEGKAKKIMYNMIRMRMELAQLHLRL